MARLGRAEPFHRRMRRDVIAFVITANAAQTLDAPTSSATAAFGPSSSAAQTLAAPTTAVVANFGPTSSAAQTLAPPTSDVIATFTPSGGGGGDANAMAAQTLAPPTTAVVVNVGNNITVNQTLDPPTTVGPLYVSPAFRVAQTLEPPVTAVVATFTGLTVPTESELLRDPVKIDPRLPQPNRDYERRWLGDNMLEAQRRLRQSTFTIDLSTEAVATVASLLQQVMHRWIIPENFFIQSGQVLRLFARGTTSANVNQKTLRVKFGSTTLVTIGPFGGNDKHWSLEAIITCLDDNEQKYSAEGRVNQELPFIAQGTATEDATAEISIEITGQSDTIATAEITLQFAELQHTLRN